MTEQDARDWVAARFDAAAIDRLARLAAIVVAESDRQNLIARSTLDQIWSRHIVDSLQLLGHAHPGRWLDIGSGAGFPGLAVAAAEPHRPMILVEPRRLRADYLRQAALSLGLSNVEVIAAKVESVREKAQVISARAVARIAALFAAACRVAPVVAESSEEDELALEAYGRNLGIAFQLTDDVIDYASDTATMGKGVGDDFRDGKMTLPVILAYVRGSEGDRAFWRAAMGGERISDKDLAQAISLLRASDALSDTVERARQYGRRAIDALARFPASKAKSALIEAAEFAVARAY